MRTVKVVVTWQSVQEVEVEDKAKTVETMEQFKKYADLDADLAEPVAWEITDCTCS